MQDCYTLEDLASRQILDHGHGKPARLAVIGFPVAHSASPRMHQPALDQEGTGSRYVKIAVPPGKVAEAFQRMRDLGFTGCNVTVPHKFDALAACDVTDAGARDMGAVNTVRFDTDATRGFNTDGYGFEAAVHEAFGIQLTGRRILIAGAGGGAGSALAVHCARSGAAGLVLANRTLSRILPLAERITRGHGTLVTCLALDDLELGSLAAGCSLLVNTSSAGLKDTDPSPLDPSIILPEHYVFDTIYQPPRTALLQAAEAAGARTANGASMLLHQGARAFEIWFPGTQPLAAMRQGLSASQG